MKTAAHVGAALCLATCLLSATHPQEQPEIERTDPVAVAQAYLQACSDADVDTALSLLAADDEFRDSLRRAAGFLDDVPADEFTWEADFRMFQYLPCGIPTVPAKRELADSAVEADTARITFAAACTFDQELVLKRQPDGTWGVDLEETAKAMGESSLALLTHAIMSGDVEEEESTAKRYDCESRLRDLWRAMYEYATDHEGKLPPAERWVDELELYVLDRSLFRNPQQPDLEYAFAMNVEAGGRDVQDLEAWAEDWDPEDFVVLFEWPRGGRNACCSLEELATLNSQQQEGGLAYITASWRIDTLPPGMTWAQKNERDRGKAAEMWEFALRSEPMHRCEAHLYALAQAARRYARDHEGLLPGPDTSQDDIAHYLLEADDLAWELMLERAGGEDDIFRCPALPDVAYAYAINAEIAGKNALDLTGHDQIALFYESDLNMRNAAGSPKQDGARAGRHIFPHGHAEDLEMGSLVVYLSGDIGWLERPDDEEGPDE